MKRFLLAVFLMMFAGSAMAHACPALMAQIDEILEGDQVESHLEADILTEVMQLREDGEAYHEAGDHDRSMEALERALELLAAEEG